ncbi:DUF3106 domain-containing protein [Nocardia sp. NEAU-G5]|uniref:DUF3106 domain-containing protein n=1 Tax=Nocardia albiluteola TaxID=2842303 RepID=A0ABS6AUS2_9NOCA|nr:DUF3106 domain-containing protein [Nocardia albiluteola]MBU3061628.1 DUF3106 domain-containing protein [Nocardia albiluteola]
MIPAEHRVNRSLFTTIASVESYPQIEKCAFPGDVTAFSVVGMTKPQRDPSIDRLRHDVDDIYELLDDTNRTAHTTQAAVRGVDLRLRRFQRTTGHQFGVVLGMLRQHNKRFERLGQQTAERFKETTERFDQLEHQTTERFNETAQRFDQLEHQTTERFNETAQRFDQLEHQTTERFNETAERFNRLDNQLGEIVQLLQSR